MNADWWSGLPRLQHRHKLQSYIAEMRQQLPVFVALLSSFIQNCLRQLHCAFLGCPLSDVPVEPFPDPQVLHMSTSLTADG